MTPAPTFRLLPRLRFLSPIVALLGLVLLATVSVAPALRPPAPGNFPKSDVRATLVVAGSDLSVSAASSGAFEDWDDETKTTLPRCELPDSAPRSVAHATPALFPPRCFARVTDRRTATLVGTVVLLI